MKFFNSIPSQRTHCYVVRAFYKDELYQSNETPMYEESICRSYEAMLKEKSEYEQDDDFAEVMYYEDDLELI